LREREGFGYDEVSAVFRAGADDLVDAQKRLVALKAIRKSKNFEPLAVSFKRIRKILEKLTLLPGMGGTSIRNFSRVAPNANFIPQFAEPRQRCKPTSAREVPGSA